MLVSTMDGHVTALDAHTGEMKWTVGTGSRPLLSSSISHYEVN